MFKNITIIGDGAMGTVSAMMLCSNGLNVKMWGHDKALLAEFGKARENTAFLPGYKLPDNLCFDGNDETAMQDADMIVSAVPCQFVEQVWSRLKEFVPPKVPIVSVTKGIEIQSLRRPSEILEDVLGSDRPYISLSGPTIADELAQGLPATACAACPDMELASEVQQAFSTKTFRVYINDDIVGVELAGAMKNVIAIAAGIIDGCKLGDNAKAALLARGLAEITRLGIAMGAKEQTFAGLTGLGDLVTTCISPMGRNRSFGERIGKGMTAKEALKATNSVVEGEATCRSVVYLSEKYKVEMPIATAVFMVVTDQLSVKDALEKLMSRELKAE